MIARTWRGWTSAEDADCYLEYIRRTGLAEYGATAGNRGAVVFRRREGERTEFFVLSLWDSMDAVRRFAGPQPERAVFYPQDGQFLVARETEVTHYEVADGERTGNEVRALFTPTAASGADR